MTVRIDGATLSAFVVALRVKGLSVGLDDVARVECVFGAPEAQGWDAARSLRAFKALIARSEHERHIIDEIGAGLLQEFGADEAAPRGPQVPKAAEREVATTRSEVSDSPPRRRLTQFLIAGVLVIASGTMALWVARPRVANRTEPGIGAALTETKPATPVIPHAPRAASPEALLETVIRELPAPPSLGSYLGLALAGILAAVGMAFLALFVRELGLNRKRMRAVERLNAHPGPRIFRLRSDKGGPVRPIPTDILREVAFDLSRPRVASSVAVLDPVASIEATVRAVGCVRLVYRPRYQQAPLMFIEDLESMGRWPHHGQQIAEAFEAQGREFDRVVMHGSLRRLSGRRDDPVTRSLDDLAEERGDCDIVIFSSGHESTDQSLPRMAGAKIWINPLPRDQWRAPPREDDVVMVPADRLGELIRPSGMAVRVWSAPPVPEDASPTWFLQSWRVALGPEAFAAFAVGALLARARSWDTSSWWRMLCELPGPDVPWRQHTLALERINRVWELPGVRIAANGAIAVPHEPLESLIAFAQGQYPTLFEQAASWIVSRMIQWPPSEGSLASIVSDICRDRVARAAGLAELGAAKRVDSEGLGNVVRSVTTRAERRSWGVRERPVQRPRRWWPIAGAVGIAAALALALAIRKGVLFPRQPAPRFEIDVPAHPRIGNVLEIAGAYTRGRSLTATVVKPDGTTAAIGPLPAGVQWTIPLDPACCLPEGRHELRLSLRGDPSQTLPVEIQIEKEAGQVVRNVGHGPSAERPPAAVAGGAATTDNAGTRRWKEALAQVRYVPVVAPSVRGSLTKEIIRRIIRLHINEVRYCYENYPAANRIGLTGRVAVQFTIAATGQVIASVLQNSTLNNARIEDCTVRAVRRWEFPKPLGGGIVIVGYPFDFSPTGEELRPDPPLGKESTTNGRLTSGESTPAAAAPVDANPQPAADAGRPPEPSPQESKPRPRSWSRTSATISPPDHYEMTDQGMLIAGHLTELVNDPPPSISSLRASRNLPRLPLASPITFRPGSYAISSPEILNAVALRLLKFPELHLIEIRVHSGRPWHSEEDANVEELALTRNRAEVVRQALEARGVEKGRLHAEGVGGLMPLCREDTDACRSRNERVELIVRREGFETKK